jgi:hypothetical protein
MKIHPLIAAAALLLVGVMAFGATVVVQHRRERARRPPPVPEVDDAPPVPRQVAPVVAAPRRRPAPPPPPAPPTAELHVHVTGPHGITPDSVEVSARRRGDEEDTWTSLDEADDDEAGARPGTFSGTDLVAGRYDLEIEAHGMRAAHVDDVPTGAKAIEIALERAPLLLGALGTMGEEGCAGVSLQWSGPDGEAGGQTEPNADDCTFVVETLPEPGPVTVVASAGTRRESALVTLPLSGDPTFLCLAPPCASAPASLLVFVADADHRELDDATLTWTLHGDDFHGEMGTSTGTGLIYVHGRRVGQTLKLRAESGARAVETTVVVGPGVTEVLLTLPAEEPAPEDDPDDVIEIRPRAGRSIHLVGAGGDDPPSPASGPISGG